MRLKIPLIVSGFIMAETLAAPVPLGATTSSGTGDSWAQSHVTATSVPSPTGRQTTSGMSSSTPPVPSNFQGALPSWAAGGATMFVLAWPDLSQLTRGETAPFTVIQSQPVAGSSFSISVGNGASTNLQLLVSDGIHAAAINEGYGGDNSGQTLTDVTPNLRKTAHIQSRVIQTGAWSSMPIKTGDPMGGPAPKLTITLNGCSATLVNFEGYETQNIGEVHTYSGVTATYSYGVSSTNSVTIGFSSSGANGSFGADGTYNSGGGQSGNVSVPSGTHDHVTAQWSEGKFYQSCIVGRTAIVGYYDVAYNFQPDSLKLGSSVATNPLGYCPYGTTSLPAGGGIVTESYGSSTSYSWQIDLLGATLGEQTIYSSDTQIAYKPSASQTTALCGPGGSPPGGQAIIYNSLFG